MTDMTSRFELPFILPNQAQKHVTHNVGIARLDAITHLSVDAFDIDAPPSAPENGATYVISSDPIGEFSTHAGQIASWSDFGWMFFIPKSGWIAWSKQDSEIRIFDGSGWGPLDSNPVLQNIEGIGIGTSFDATNKFSISSEASLFSHAGGNHFLKLNKNLSTDTVSMLFQSNWSGRAEIGLVGNDNLAIKVSDDGSTFKEAISINSGSGVVDAKAMRSLQIDVGADQAVAVTTPAKCGIVAISMTDPTDPKTSHSGLFSYVANSTPELLTLAKGSRLLNQGGASLTGTTGTAHYSSIAVGNDELVIENRSSTTLPYSVTFIGA